MISDNIEIVVVDVKGDQVKIGIKAPKSISVHRKEVYEEIQRENKLAANMKIDDISKLSGMLKKKN